MVYTCMHYRQTKLEMQVYTLCIVSEVGVNISFFSEFLVSTQLDEILQSTEGKKTFVVHVYVQPVLNNMTVGCNIIL